MNNHKRRVDDIELPGVLTKSIIVFWIFVVISLTHWIDEQVFVELFKGLAW